MKLAGSKQRLHVLEGMCYGACVYAAIAGYLGVGAKQIYDILPILIPIGIAGSLLGALARRPQKSSNDGETARSIE